MNSTEATSARAGLELPSSELVAKYNRPGPRYTSYPAAPYWSGAYGGDDYRGALAELGRRMGGRPGAALSLYVHIPFCEHLCTFCACNMIVSRAHERGRAYVERIAREMDLVLAAMELGGLKPPVIQVHWGGGTPTWLSPDELVLLHEGTASRFELLPEREQSIEVDPRVTTPEQLAALRECGLNRISMGVQDFNPVVQRAIHRVQSVEQTAAVVNASRRLGIEGINADLVYGLPHQTREAFAETVRTVIGLGVDRIALYNFAHFPDRMPRHRAIRAEWLPTAETRIELFRDAAALFVAAGYDMIGLDHFARKSDELATAAAIGALRRNFMGYTTHAGDDMLGFGVSSIGRVGRDFAQTIKTTGEYEDALEAGRLPIERGLRLSNEDLAREWVIQSIMCYGEVDLGEAESRGVDALGDSGVRARLQELEGDGLVEWSGRTLRVTVRGRYFLRNVAMVFDAYLGRAAVLPAVNRQSVELRFSRTV
jgi:oxygen-independent coproporphyrinogen III oxidase